ncbi:hypothetical protein [Sphingobium sp.]|uniref:hypothetical protein n=1 Tax=Sphingobium sp. TaxID=1912891 RepID=UPI001A261086|nr:hypothetical protein [Sphingobium sp.]MBJ7377053.1 hypothetical protein [Sphingobium sp.]
MIGIDIVRGEYMWVEWESAFVIEGRLVVRSMLWLPNVAVPTGTLHFPAALVLVLHGLQRLLRYIDLALFGCLKRLLRRKGFARLLGFGRGELVEPHPVFMRRWSHSPVYSKPMRRLLFWTEVIVVAGLTLWGFAQTLLSSARTLWNAL